MPSAIDRDMKSVIVKTFTDEVDEYGQKHTHYVESTISMFVRKYKQTIVDSPIYNSIELIGLTKSSLNDNCNVIIDNKEYHVKFTIDSNSYTGVQHYQQVFLELYGNN